MREAYLRAQCETMSLHHARGQYIYGVRSKREGQSRRKEEKCFDATKRDLRLVASASEARPSCLLTLGNTHTPTHCPLISLLRGTSEERREAGEK